MPVDLCIMGTHRVHNAAGAVPQHHPVHDEENSSQAANRRPLLDNSSIALLPRKAPATACTAEPVYASTPAERIQLLHFLCMSALETGTLRSDLPQHALADLLCELIVHA